MKIGIVTEISYNICNYGNVLQAYALNRFIRDRYEYDVYTIELKKQKKSVTSPILYFMKSAKAILAKKRKVVHVVDKEKHNKFFNYYIENIPTIVVNRFNDIYDKGIEGYIVGADVVWHQEHAFINSLKFLDFDKKYTPIKVSYAASFGNNWIPNENRNKIKKCLDKFRGVSVREESGREVLNDIGVNNVYHVLDPVFLLTPESWMKCSKKPSLNTDNIKNYCLVYLLNPQEYEMDFVRLLGKETKCNIIFVPYVDDSLKKYDLTDKMCVYEKCGPEEWIWLIENASYVVTDSFHCIAFSIIFKKNFYAMDRGKMMSRIVDILSKTSLTNRFITSETDFSGRIDDICYGEATKYLDNKINESIGFLDDCLRV